MGIGDEEDGPGNVRFLIYVLEDMGYVVNFAKLNSVDFGLPQSRVRLYFWAVHWKGMFESVEDDS